MNCLPVELLSKIFELSTLKRRDHLALLLVCRAFKTQAQRVIYRDIRITYQTRGRTALYDLLAHDASVASFIHLFSLDARKVELANMTSSRRRLEPSTPLDASMALSRTALRSNFQKRSPPDWDIVHKALQNSVQLKHYSLDFGGDIKSSDDHAWLFAGCSFKLKSLRWPFVLTPAMAMVLEQQDELRELEMAHATGFVHATSTGPITLPSQKALPDLRILIGPALFIGEMRQRYPHITHIRFTQTIAFQSISWTGVRVLVTSLQHLNELMRRVDAACPTLEYIQVDDEVGQTFQQLRLAFRDSLAPSNFPSLRVLRIFTGAVQEQMQQFEILAMPLSLAFPRLQTIEVQKRSDRPECWRWTKQNGMKMRKMGDVAAWKSY